GVKANNGNVYKQTVTAPSVGMAAIVTTYGYDGANRITGVAENPANASIDPVCTNGQAGWCQLYSLDVFGNSTVGAHGASSGETGVTFDTVRNRINSANWNYNDRGGVVKDPTVRSYGYDAEGRMAGTCGAGETPCPNAWTLGGQREVYTYDGEGRRVREDKKDGSWTMFAYDAAGELATEYTTAGTGIVGTRYLTGDALGSVG